MAKEEPKKVTAPTPPPEATKAPSDEAVTSSNSVRIKFAGSQVIRRTITAADFKKVGIEGQEKLVWSKENNHTVDLTDAPEGVVDFLLEMPDNEFKLLRPGQI